MQGPCGRECVGAEVYRVGLLCSGRPGVVFRLSAALHAVVYDLHGTELTEARRAGGRAARLQL